MGLIEVDDIQSGSSSSPEISCRSSVSALKASSNPVGLEEFPHVNDPGEKLNLFDELKQRLCPSTILGFRRGEAFMIRNVANLVPPLEVENILIIGHSCCGGIQTLMSMRDNGDSSFIKTWVSNGRIAKNRTESAANHLSFDQQCRLCEKVSTIFPEFGTRNFVV
ncbi:Beta carbonic anhydrase 6 [Hibiscus syriacus]|uniref:Carbonic anhydrase n=1 Tax=Hibiscus syriacus TaxID=106335 RepID=A0A6A3BI04_HIBSY|nr:Beta carbonic anhydrase 6 [Hibiscus syriacus]